jgi:hypothetical protein
MLITKQPRGNEWWWSPHTAPYRCVRCDRVLCYDIGLGCDLMSQCNMTAPSTNDGEPDITQCLTEVQIDTYYVS